MCVSDRNSHCTSVITYIYKTYSAKGSVSSKDLQEHKNRTKSWDNHRIGTSNVYLFLLDDLYAALKVTLFVSLNYRQPVGI